MANPFDDLLSAAQDGNLESLMAALRAGTDITGKVISDTSTPIWGKAALHLAAARGHIDVAKELLAAGADPNAMSVRTKILTGEAPLHIAARNGHVDMCRVLLAGGAKPDLRQIDRYDAPGRFPLQLAVEGNHMEVLRLLLQTDYEAAKVAASAALYEAAEAGRESLMRRMALS